LFSWLHIQELTYVYMARNVECGTVRVSATWAFDKDKCQYMVSHS